MGLKVVVTAVVMSFVSVAGLEAQRLSPPAERPPANYKGQQYIDSRGCVFTRAGINGQNTWVPRVGLDKKQLCGPSRQAAAQALDNTPAAPPVPQAPAVAPQPAVPAAVAKPAAPAKPAEPAQVAAAPAAPAAPERNAACPAAHPYGQYISENGRRRLLCGSAPNFDASAEAKRIDQAKVAQAQAPVQTQVAAAPAAAERVKPMPAKPVAAPPVMAPVAAPVVAAAPSTHKSCPPQHPYGQVISEGGRQRLLCSDQPKFDAKAAAQRIDQAKATEQATARAAEQARVAPQGGTVFSNPVSAETGRDSGMTYGREPQPMRPRGAPLVGATPMSFAPQAVAPSAVLAMPSVPAGYKLAWEDDRLNPYRAQGHAAGEAAQDKVWERTVPARMKKDVVMVVVPAAAPPLAVSQSAQAVAGKGYLIQIASFRDQNNAASTMARFQAMGLPMRSQNARGLQVVQAGPFADVQAARRALAQVQGAGFRDAYLR